MQGGSAGGGEWSAEAVRRELVAASEAHVPGVTFGDKGLSRVRVQAQRAQQQVSGLRAARRAAVRRHGAAVRALEVTMLRGAKARAMAAQQARRSEAVRARRFVEDLARRSVGQELARASKQDAVAAALMRAVAREERAAALEGLRARAEAAEREADKERAMVTRRRNAARVQLELEDEAARRDAESRFAAAVGLAAAIRGEVRAVREAQSSARQ